MSRPSGCEKCWRDVERTGTLERHRIMPGRNGGKYEEGNISYLCAACHEEWQSFEAWYPTFPYNAWSQLPSGNDMAMVCWAALESSDESDKIIVENFLTLVRDVFYKARLKKLVEIERRRKTETKGQLC